VGAEHIHNPGKILLLMVLEFVPAGPDTSGCRSYPEQGDFISLLIAQVQQFLFEDSFNPMPTSINRPENLRKHFAGIYNPAQGIVDDRGRAS
jgi:hypothetical protein